MCPLIKAVSKKHTNTAHKTINNIWLLSVLHQPFFTPKITIGNAQMQLAVVSTIVKFAVQLENVECAQEVLQQCISKMAVLMNVDQVPAS